MKLQAKCVLLDIEGTISDIRFVYDVMFPYAKKNMPSFLVENWESTEVKKRSEPSRPMRKRDRSRIGLVRYGSRQITMPWTHSGYIFIS